MSACLRAIGVSLIAISSELLAADGRTVEILPYWWGAVEPVAECGTLTVTVREADGSLATNGFVRVGIDEWDSGRSLLNTNVCLALANPFRYPTLAEAPCFWRVTADGVTRGIPFEPGRVAPHRLPDESFAAFWRRRLSTAETNAVGVVRLPDGFDASRRHPLLILAGPVTPEADDREAIRLVLPDSLDVATVAAAVKRVATLCDEPYVDRRDVRALGVGKGGALVLAVTALAESRVTRVASLVPEFGATAEFLGGADFAARVTCPLRMAVGFDDTVATPPSVYGAYNAAPSRDKDILHGVSMGHDVRPDLMREVLSWLKTGAFVSRRPAPEKRSFRSAAVDAKIAEIKGRLSNPRLAWMFENCFPNTLDTTVRYRRTPDGRDETFVLTGDIPAMWLRDSAAQVWPYLALAKDDGALRRMIRGVVRKQCAFIQIDGYANAFNDSEDGGPSDVAKDGVRVDRRVFERKYELDSLCYPLRLAEGYVRSTGDRSILDADFVRTVKTVVDTIREQQRKDGYRTPYYFVRNAPRNNAIDNRGWGRQTRPVGLVVSAFRPSDDATVLPFFVPSNFMAADVLAKTGVLLREMTEESELARTCGALAEEISAALHRHALLVNPETGRRQWAYEVDGYGSAVFMDDANVPSLLALPYFTDIAPDDPDYLATRDFVWSEMNPYFFRGRVLEGIGGPHCSYGTVWPMSLILRALTSTDDAEIRASIEGVIHSDGGTGFVHESVGKDDQKFYSRDWFAWANTLFGELIYRLYESGRIDLLNSVE